MILPPLKQVWLLKNRYYSVNTAKPAFAAGDIFMLKETYGKEGQVFGSSRSRMYTVSIQQKGGPAIPKKKFVRQFLTANVNPFHVSC